jgi:hypothetical protein
MFRMTVRSATTLSLPECREFNTLGLKFVCPSFTISPYWERQE